MNPQPSPPPSPETLSSQGADPTLEAATLIIPVTQRPDSARGDQDVNDTQPKQLSTLVDPQVASELSEAKETPQPKQSEPPVPHPLDAAPGSPQVPGYQIEKEIAQGGMGQVWAGIDLELEREVAIKTILPGREAKRFIAEAKITAQLPHPGIPPVYRLGMLPDGSHFLAMKLVHGRTFADLLKERPAPETDLSRFIQMFEQIAQAVGFAHVRGIIHRDLKPSNIMVGAFGEVQVMDWGLAKHLTNSEPPTALSGRTETPAHAHLTHAGTILGTPGYMAPEQARGEAGDARSDVFALGSILAAILTGQPAFAGKPVSELLKITSQAELADVWARLDSCGMDSELVELAKRCLSARAEDRPPNAQVVATTVSAYRAGVEARLRQAETEKAERLVRELEQRKRQRMVRWGASLVAAVLVVGMSVSLWQMYRAVTAERLAKENELQAIQAAAAERQANALAQQERDAKEQQRRYAQAIADFVQNDFFALTSIEGQGRFGGAGLDKNTTLGQLLDRAAAKLRDRKDLDPRTEADLSWMIGVNYRGAGDAAKGVPFLERAWHLRSQILGTDHEDTLNAANSLAAGYYTAGKLDLALPLYEETLQRFEAKFGPDHLFTLGSMNNLAGCYRTAGKLDLALPLYEKTLRLFKAKFGPDHPSTITTMGNLAEGYRAARKLDLALPLYEETLRLRTAKLGPDHHHTLTSMAGLAEGYRDAGRLDLALPLYEETLRLRTAKLGPDHPNTLRSKYGLAMAYQAARKLDSALTLYAEAALELEKQGFQHELASRIISNTIRAYERAKEFEKANEWRQKWLTHLKHQTGTESAAYTSELAALGVSLLQQRKWSDADNVLRECFAIRTKVEPEMWTTFYTQSLLGGALLGQEKYAEAEPLLLEGFEGIKERLASPGTDAKLEANQKQRLAEACDRLIELYSALDKPDEVQKWQAERGNYVASPAK